MVPSLLSHQGHRSTLLAVALVAIPTWAASEQYVSTRQERDKTAADLSRIVYEDSSERAEELNATFGDRFELVADESAIGGHHGFEAIAVREKATSNIFIAYEGTKDRDDFWVDADLVIETKLGHFAKDPTAIDSPYLDTHVDQAMTFYDHVKATYPNSPITLTGHSLGGTDAQVVGAKHGVPTVTFESPGVPPTLLQRLGIQPKTTLDMVDYQRSSDEFGSFGRDIGTTVQIVPSERIFSVSPEGYLSLGNPGLAAKLLFENFMGLVAQHAMPDIADDLRAMGVKGKIISKQVPPTETPSDTESTEEKPEAAESGDAAPATDSPVGEDPADIADLGNSPETVELEAEEAAEGGSGPEDEDPNSDEVTPPTPKPEKKKPTWREDAPYVFTLAAVSGGGGYYTQEQQTHTGANG
jgi:hypothetical protein